MSAVEPRADAKPPVETARERAVLLLRYGELSLKGGNRPEFERRLAQNVRRALRPITAARVERLQGRIVVEPERRAREAAERLRRVFGLVSISPARWVPLDRERIEAAALAAFGEALESRSAGERATFRVLASRAEKSFPLGSVEVNRWIGSRVLERFAARARVRLDDPEIELGIDLRREGALVYAAKLEGPGGLPVGTLGRVACLLSGGIDSPVAAWLAMKRGCRVDLVHFHSQPFTGPGGVLKARRLAEVLAGWQGPTRFHAVPLAEAQTAIRDRAPEALRTLLYRRAMHRAASVLAAADGAQALVTGDSLGQVASQTLENLAAVSAANALPVLRPLVSFDKMETVALARRIGTYAISIEPEADCCSLFQPRRPALRATAEQCELAERDLDVPALVRSAVGRATVEDLDPDG
jgi:thiamine biosynthesis protein ThiI